MIFSVSAKGCCPIPYPYCMGGLYSPPYIPPCVAYTRALPARLAAQTVGKHPSRRRQDVQDIQGRIGHPN